MNVKEAHPGPATGSGAIFLPTGFSRATSPVSDPFSQGSNLKFEDRVSPMVPIILHSILLPQIDVFYERLNDIIPIIPKAHLVSRINRGDHETSADFAALLLTMAALALTQPVATDEMRNLDSSTKQARGLLDEACRLKGSANLGESVSLETVLSSFLLSWCFLGLGRSDISWFRLKEAVTRELADFVFTFTHATAHMRQREADAEPFVLASGGDYANEEQVDREGRRRRY
jgi:hypothetical protein